MNSSELRPGVLISHAMVREEPRLLDWIAGFAGKVPVLIDSGAFSNLWLHQRELKTGVSGVEAGKWLQTQVELDEYIKVCHEHYHGRVWRYVSLDVIRQPRETRQNYEEMLQAGLRPMPVWTDFATIDDGLEMLATAPEDTICVAGVAKCSEAHATRRFGSLFEASGKRAKIHALGYTRSPGVFHQPISTCDSHSWVSGQRFAVLHPYSRATRRFSNLVLPWHTRNFKMSGKRCSMTPREVGAYIARLIEVYHVPWSELKVDKFTGSESACSLLDINYFFDFADHLAEQGKRVFLVTGMYTNCFSIAAVSATHRKDGSFDYMESRDVFRELKALWQVSHEQCIAACAEYMVPREEIQ